MTRDFAQWGWYIMAQDRGFVSIVKTRLCSDLLYHWECDVEAIIRRWGTASGLAELCDGPTGETILDTVNQGAIPFRSVIKILYVTEEGEKKWTEVLAKP